MYHYSLIFIVPTLYRLSNWLWWKLYRIFVNTSSSFLYWWYVSRFQWIDGINVTTYFLSQVKLHSSRSSSHIGSQEFVRLGTCRSATTVSKPHERELSPLYLTNLHPTENLALCEFNRFQLNKIFPSLIHILGDHPCSWVATRSPWSPSFHALQDQYWPGSGRVSTADPGYFGSPYT